MSTERYPHATVEPKWQRYWLDHETFRAHNGSDRPKYYVLDMFPYPSGSGLHVGHPEGYTATDILARYKWMRGFNVLHPMGWDAFGLPAEQHAIATGTHPVATTKKNIATFKRQILRLGLAYDWRREVNTTDPDYFRWTQWIFLQLFDKGLAYEAEVAVNWCPALGTVLANEEVIDGRSERGNHTVVRKPMRQWMLKITAFAERLIDDLDEVDWPESIKAMQRNWIGKSVGAEVDFRVADHDATMRVFTTRPDTLFGATYMVMAPEHALVDKITTAQQREAVRAYVEKASRKSDMDRTDLAKEKTGVFSGAYAINPVNDARIPIWIADYVLASYGTGAIMAVPAHDSRDYEFARQFDIPIIAVVGLPDGSVPDLSEEAYTEVGVAVNSGSFDGLSTEAFKARITAWLAEHGLGERAVNYRLRDWLFSRQRFWGEPFPIIHLEDGTVKAIPYDELPLTLPHVESYKPTGTGEPPLAAVTEWLQTTDAETGLPARRETNTMPQWAGSSWYYLRYCDPDYTSGPISPEAENYWMPVDLYVGGAEHAVLHLLYARFWHKVLYDCGVVHTKEPFQRLVNQGMILGNAFRYYAGPEGEAYPVSVGRVVDNVPRHVDSDVELQLSYVHTDDVRWVGEGKDRLPMHPDADFELEVLVEKMSKSKRNVVNPDDVVADFGADALRLYEMFMGPLEAVKPWNTKDIVGISRFLDRVWKLNQKPLVDGGGDEALVRLTHKTIKKVGDDIEGMRFNTAISAMMVLTNELAKQRAIPREALSALVRLLNPFAPHIAEEIWVETLGNEASATHAPWPTFDPDKTVDAQVTIVVQVNGKVRARFDAAKGTAKSELEAEALALENIQQHTAGKTVRKVIVIPDRLVNVVAT